jgi:2-C-methyl-D-erythritol 4-phosphate cytidylyltransferase / 2-C-methyl-D-erythritol 2,4-cyclodiphosphate synthase
VQQICVLMPRHMKIAAIIVAAGKGERAGTTVPKQYSLLAGQPILRRAVCALASHPAFSEIIVVIGQGQEDLAQAALDGVKVDAIVLGGAERQDSVAAGLAAVHHADRVFIHDAARPIVPHRVIDRLIASLETHQGAVPALTVVDTLARGDAGLGEVVDREGLVRVQTPQAFHLEAIRHAHRQWQGPAATDDAQIARAAGFAVALVEGDPMLDKITRPRDFEAAEQKLAASMVSRTGMGFDVHRLGPDEELWLGGVLIPHDKGLVGHSDADVALHALTDALLGALGDGDIGSHFPPTDPQWRGAASHRFAEHAASLIRSAQGRIDHVDITLICEAPKIGPHRNVMRARIAEMLDVQPQQVSVKATTTEKLGFTGRGEGIAAQAVATIRLPEDLR